MSAMLSVAAVTTLQKESIIWMKEPQGMVSAPPVMPMHLVIEVNQWEHTSTHTTHRLSNASCTINHYFSLPLDNLSIIEKLVTESTPSCSVITMAKQTQSCTTPALHPLTCQGSGQSHQWADKDVTDPTFHVPSPNVPDLELRFIFGERDQEQWWSQKDIPASLSLAFWVLTSSPHSLPLVPVLELTALNTSSSFPRQMVHLATVSTLQSLLSSWPPRSNSPGNSMRRREKLSGFLSQPML
jgi:hypothetical protein